MMVPLSWQSNIISGNPLSRTALSKLKSGFESRYRCQPHLFLAFCFRYERGPLTGHISEFPVKPCTKRSALEAVETAPGALKGFLDKILGFVHGAKHAVTMQFDFAAERFGELVKRVVCTLRGLLLVGWFGCHCNTGTTSRPFPVTMNTFPLKRSGFVDKSMTAFATPDEVGGESML